MTPEKGSFIEYNAASPESISDQQFITWHDKTPKELHIQTSDSISTVKTDSTSFVPVDIPSDMHINFLINMTPDATLRVLMDKTTEDYIAQLFREVSVDIQCFLCKVAEDGNLYPGLP